MKILFAIASINSKSNGLGGHYHSLLTAAKQLSREHEIIIVNIGNNPSKALENCEFKTYALIYKNMAVIKVFNQLTKIINKEKPEILHAFDVLAFYWVRLAGHRLKTPFYLTKCGGANPVYFPYIENLILFSSENLEYFKSKKKFSNSKLHFVPNRIKKFSDDMSRLEKIHHMLGECNQTFKFLRIARIGNYYHKSSLQLINLVNKLNKEGVSCCAIFIGTIEDNEYLDKLESAAEGSVFFFTNDEFTKNAKELIDCSDATLGTGRSFMEAASKGKLLLSPINNKSEIPVLITKNNFDDAFHYNFSERVQLKDYNENENYIKIKLAIKNKALLQQYNKYSNHMFEYYFDGGKILKKYNKVYSEKKASRIHVIDFILHTMFLIRSHFRK
jgi:glycosyltransferase involved in cell wall biosynthesis